MDAIPVWKLYQTPHYQYTNTFVTRQRWEDFSFPLESALPWKWVTTGYNETVHVPQQVSA